MLNSISTLKINYLKISILFNAFFIISSVFGQKIISNLNYEEGTIKYSEEVRLGKTPYGYTLFLPENEKPTGLIVFFHIHNPSSNPDSIVSIAIKNNLGVLYTSTSNKLEFLFEKDAKNEIALYLKEVLEKYPAVKENLLFAGMSLEGTRALLMTQYLYENKGFDFLPKAIALCDSPLDMERFYKTALKSANLNYQEAASSEGKLVSAYLKSNLGNPDTDIEPYRNYSPYCFSKIENEYLSYLDNIAIRAYTEPDVNWWMDTRRKSYYGMNAIDLAALVNELNIRGNTRAKLITTRDKGFKPDGSRHPHSWSIVDEVELIHWFLSL